MPDDKAPLSSPYESAEEPVDTAVDVLGEDADTAAARKELKHTVISDTAPKTSSQDSAAEDSVRVATPESDDSDARNDALKEQVSSPKKKRAHDEVEDDKTMDKTDAKSETSTDSARDRAARTEPEKKRPRDEVSDDDENKRVTAGSRTGTPTGISAASEAPQEPRAPSTSADKFQASGFGQLGQSAVSGFGALSGANGKSVFGKPLPAQSVFAPSASKTTPISPPTLSFGAGASGTSPFGTLANPSSNGFSGSVFGSSTFGGSSPWATSSIKPLGGGFGNGQPLGSSKAAKPFGAPDSGSDEEEDAGSNASDDAGENSQGDAKDEAKNEVGRNEGDEKKPKLQKVTVDDGEAGEVSLLQVRAKMFYVDKAEDRWVERGSGMLKVNAPESCVSFDNMTGLPIPGSFDASGLEEGDEEAGNGTTGHKTVRLLMRQDHTHRVLLNTAILPAMTFQEKATLKSVGILFTAFEGDDAKPVSVQLKMSAANAKSFLNEIGLVQRELQGN